MMASPDDRAYVELGITFSKGVFGAPVTKTQTEILRMLFTPEEAHCAAALDFVPEPEEVIAARAGMAPDVAADLLTRMASRGLIRGVRRPDGVRVFRQLLFAPGLYEILHVYPLPSDDDMERIAGLFTKYYGEAWGHALHNEHAPVARTVPHIEPPHEQVLVYEDAVKLIEGAQFAAQIQCSCRETMHNCDCPVDVCLVLGQGVLGGRIDGAPVSDPRHAVRPRIRPVSVDEAVNILNRAEEARLVHNVMNLQDDSWFMCNCCSHACFLLRGITELDIPHAVAPSSYWSVIDESECNGCGSCEVDCHVSAIKLVDGRVAKVDYERCLGCGVCVNSCPTEAIRLEKRDREIYTPYVDFNALAAARGVAPHIHSH
jgi:Pyruvate/2-oxoacid:ferredoxin oxidoreductase delta subunit